MLKLFPITYVKRCFVMYKCICYFLLSIHLSFSICNSYKEHTCTKTVALCDFSSEGIYKVEKRHCATEKLNSKIIQTNVDME